MTPEELIARLIHRDASVLVLDKPAGLPVHRGPKGGETLTDHLDSLRFGLKWRPELAHRLDRETSGCLALGRHPRALRDLNDLFRTGRARKIYWAVVEGGPAADGGLIDLALAKKSPERGWWMKPDEAGLPARTRFRVLGRAQASPVDASVLPRVMAVPGLDPGISPAIHELKRAQEEVVDARPKAGHDAPILYSSAQALTWLELEPLTGRTHQLRVHCAASGFPILGDAIYGTGERQFDRNAPPMLHLHARSLELPLNPKKPAIVCEAPAPEHMREKLAFCNSSEACF